MPGRAFPCAAFLFFALFAPVILDFFEFVLKHKPEKVTGKRRPARVHFRV